MILEIALEKKNYVAKILQQNTTSQCHLRVTSVTRFKFNLL